MSGADPGLGLERTLATAEGRLEVATRAAEFAEQAGQGLLEHFERLEATQVRSKDVARDLVTEADLASERHLVRCLREAYPTTAIEAEEEVRDEAGPGLRWFLDPLDGTVNFVHGLPCFAVSVALYRDREPLAGCVHLPRLGETFLGAQGAGAFLGSRRLQISRTDDLGQAVLATGFPYRRGELPNDNLGNAARLVRPVRGLRRMGSAAVDLAYTAAGRLDGYWELHLAPHDVAAGALLILEAGGVVQDLRGGQDWLRGGSVVAGPGELVRKLAERTTDAPDPFPVGEFPSDQGAEA